MPEGEGDFILENLERKLDIKGNITFEREVEGKPPEKVALLGNLTVRDGKVFFELLSDYHIFYNPSSTGGWWTCVQRPVVDREKYPNWPNPEPGWEEEASRQRDELLKKIKTVGG